MEIQITKQRVNIHKGYTTHTRDPRILLTTLAWTFQYRLAKSAFHLLRILGVSMAAVFRAVKRKYFPLGI